MSKFKDYKYRANKNGTDFTIPEIVFEHLLKQECYYCKTDDVVGVDRLDNDLGYVSGNCVPSCWTCNRAKSNSTAFEFIEYLKRFNVNLEIRHNPKVIHWDSGKAILRNDIHDENKLSEDVSDFMKSISRKKASFKALS